MGVDFISCDECGHNFPDCGEYKYCFVCNSHLCRTCGKKYVIPCEDEVAEAEQISESEANAVLAKSTCPFCKLTIIPSETLLAFALRLLGKTHKQLSDEYRATQAETKLS